MTASRRPARHRLVPLLVVPTLLAGCGQQSPQPPVRSLPTGAALTASAVGAAAVQTRAAELEAGLTAVLVERTYVLATAARTRSAPDLAALDASSLALVDVLDAPTEERPRLLTALRECDARQVAAAAAGAADAERAGLDACRTRLDEAVRRTAPRLSADQVEGRLAPLPVTTGDVHAAAREAAARARGTARVVAGALAADRRLGPTATPASTLRADLTWLLVEHAALATTLDTPSGDAPAAAAALTANGDDLGALLGRSYPRLRRPLAEAWNAHLDRLAGFTTAVRQRDVSRSLTLRSSVIGLSGQLGPLLDGSVRGLSAPRLQQELAPALEALVTAVEAAAVDRPDTATLRSQALSGFLPTATVISGAVAEDRRLA